MLYFLSRLKLIVESIDASEIFYLKYDSEKNFMIILNILIKCKSYFRLLAIMIYKFIEDEMIKESK